MLWEKQQTFHTLTLIFGLLLDLKHSLKRKLSMVLLFFCTVFCIFMIASLVLDCRLACLDYYLCLSFVRRDSLPLSSFKRSLERSKSQHDDFFFVNIFNSSGKKKKVPVLP